MLRPADLISKASLEEQRILHARPKGYGGKGDKWADTVLGLMIEYEAWSVLDYGCGRGMLDAGLQDLGVAPVRIREYDPAVIGKDFMPTYADLVVCTDVLEHVEPDRLDAVLKHLTMLARKAIFLVVATRASNKLLSDGRNAHLIVESAEWWEERVARSTDWQVHLGPASPLLKLSREWVAVLCPK